MVSKLPCLQAATATTSWCWRKLKLKVRSWGQLRSRQGCPISNESDGTVARCIAAWIDERCI
ncbi:hypothetical protein GNF10_33975 [Nostoc sp. UCD121]|uniref:hypothetical protein n=1 Tax=unclassified Nostoc TaxID=2593658 RepID=UPI001628AEF0|nr:MULTISPECIES: hypothetical protein [unclassified Nostoc]MBC1225063.1 hypothetical protein [Nostoc sp. UCD120]MBC1280813.1 hypothetical protein [Nostoc sp. UCD121]